MTDFLSGLGATTQPQFWLSVLEIIWINVLLSGDNAIVIALACRQLPPRQRKIGIVFGTVVALLLRLIFASVIVSLMFIPYVKIIGGAALFWIAMKLLGPNEPAQETSAPTEGVWRAIMVIAIADVVMSLDNVIAVAAAADGNFALLVFGLAISVPAIVGGATVIAAAINYFPVIVWAGAGLLGWIAGDVLASDPVIFDVAKGLGDGVHEKIKLAFEIVGVAGTLIAGLLGRARLARQQPGTTSESRPTSP
jgi:YjbE family integral membrane protein